MNWKIGQKLVCIKKGWIGTLTGNTSFCPKYGEVCVVVDVRANDGYLLILGYEYEQGYRSWYNPIGFRPLIGESAKSELISSFTEVTETSDLPIKQPEPQAV